MFILRRPQVLVSWALILNAVNQLAGNGRSVLRAEILGESLQQINDARFVILNAVKNPLG